MNAPGPTPEQAKPAQPGRDLNSAIVACFAADTREPPFPNRLVELTVALTTQRNVSLWTQPKAEDPPEVTAAHRDATANTDQQELARQILADTVTNAATSVQFQEGYLTATIALPQGMTGLLMVEMRASTTVARSLAYERLTLLSNLSFAQFRHGDMTNQSTLIQAVTAVAGGDLNHMQALADSLAQLTGADYAAVGMYKGQAVRDVTISGQQGMTKRAHLPVKLNGTMQDIAQKKVQTNERLFAAAPNQKDGLTLVLEQPTRNMGMLRLAGAIFAQAQHNRPRSNWTTARFAKIGSVLLVAIAIGLIPIPDGVNVSATVEASKTRIVTAPLSSTIAEVLVDDRDEVIAGETVLVKLDTSTLDIERLSVAAERANAVLERETARASRNAAVLRNSELEVERLDARLDLIDLQLASSQIIAPISGIAVLTDLEQRSGATVRQGQILLEISDPAALRLSLSIVDSQISRISETDVGIFRPDFDPGLRLDAQVTSISPAIDNSAEVPVILGKATFDAPATGLRPGLRGVFAVNQQDRPIWQILYRNIRDWVLLRIWI